MQETTLTQSLVTHPSGVVLESIVVNYGGDGDWESSMTRTASQWTHAGSGLTEAQAVDLIGPGEAREMHEALGSRIQLHWNDGDWIRRALA